MKRYSSTPVKKDEFTGKIYYSPVLYPNVEESGDDIYIIPSEGLYLDNIAYKYYGDATLWWVIALANNIGNGKLYVSNKSQIRIPKNISKYIQKYRRENQ